MDRTLVYMCVLLAVVTVAAARSKQPGGRNKKNKDCGEWTFGECVPKRGACGPGKKPGSRTGENCQVTERQFRCVVPCSTDERSGPQDLAGQTHGRAGRRKNAPVPCRYKRAHWGECNAATGLKTRTLELKKGDETCEKTKVESKRCKSGQASACKYRRGTWGDCDETAKQRTRTLNLKSGNSSCEATKTETKPCKARAAKSERCRYDKGKWSECDPQENTRTRTSTLKEVSADSACPATKSDTRKCKRACRYQKGEWSECNGAGMRNRADSLKPGSDATCRANRTVERKCSSGGRKQRRCQFEAWGPFGDCSNGVKTKTRKVVSGGEDCQRRGVKTKPCKV